MFRIQTMNKISSAGLSVLDKKYFQIGDSVDQPHGILVRSAAMGDYEFPSSCVPLPVPAQASTTFP